MSLSWFFGSGKKKSEAPSPPENIAEFREEYVFIEKTLRTDTDSSGNIYPTLPYALAPQPGAEASVSNTPTSVSATQNQNFLYGVQFKISEDATSTSCDSMSQIRIYANEVKSHIAQLNVKNFDYDFLVERSVKLEAD